MIQGTPVYHDFAGLKSLQADAARESPEAAREAARQFEALFVQMMLKSMREAGAVLGEERDRTYEEMFDRQISLELTRNEGLGIGELLARQLDPENAAKPSARDVLTPLVRPSAPANRKAEVSTVVQREDFQPASPEDFVAEIWPLAEGAGQRLGIDPRALVAQAALETGWGQKLIRDERGTSGNNLFGIKADQRWPGERVSVTTLEYDGGVPRRERAQFRAYPNLRDGFDDYVSFLQENPRYQDVLSGDGEAGGFASSLQQAGYATDPNYAEKIQRILQSPIIERAIGVLKNARDVPTMIGSVIGSNDL